MHLARINRKLAMALAVGVLAAMAGASAASATPVDSVTLSPPGDVSFGNAWVASSGATTGGDFDWNQAGANTNPRLMNGYIYIHRQNGLQARVQIQLYDDATNHNLVATRNGGTKTGTGAFLDTFPINVGGVAGTTSHAHINLQEFQGGNWVTVATSIQNL
jgi:hypothetical protein